MRTPLTRIPCILVLLILFIFAGTPLAADRRITLTQRIAEERLVLAERFQVSVQKCHEHKRKAAKNACIKRQRETLSASLDHLHDNPRGYFSEKEKNNQKDENLEQARKMISSGKGW